MKAKTIKIVIDKKLTEWSNSIKDEAVRELVKKNTIVTGGCIASMLLKEQVNDFDLYFRNKETVLALAHYYLAEFKSAHSSTQKGDLTMVVMEDDDGRVRFTTENGYRGATALDLPSAPPIDADDLNEVLQEGKAGVEEDGKYRPVFLSTNAITLTDKVQLVLRFYGEPDEIHKNYDFVHATNHYQSWDGDLVLLPAALESLLSKELRYVGSKYPICSLFRLRKFIKRDWTVNAGQILKMAYQVSELDLTDMKVLEDQLTGVDVSYFAQLIAKLKEAEPEKVNSAYIVEIINRMF